MMNVFIRICMLSAAMLVASVTTAHAQALVLLKGQILDNASAKKVELNFSDPSGKSVRATSAPDGSYQTVLKSGTHYTISILDDDFRKFSFQIDTPKSEKYAEMTQDFSLKAPLPTPATDAPIAKKSKKKTKAKKSTKGK